MLENLHLIRPLWLLALIPLALLAWRVFRSGDENPWQRVVDARLLPLLMTGQPRRARRSLLWLAGCGWLVASLALADPTWERKPQPVFESNAARVVVLDLSSSMNADDLKPSRLVRARYKVEDVLALGAEGQTGLVVYAGGAFVVTPLTRDANTIRSQLDALAPDLMPEDGDRADLGLLKAEDLLRHAGLATGQVLLVADGVAPGARAATAQAASRLKGDGYPVSVLAVGSADAAASLRSVAQAGGGVDLPLDGGTDALRTWVDSKGPSQASTSPVSTSAAQSWKEQGPLLVLLLLPLAALAFRRNWLLGLVLVPLLTLHPHDAMAATWTDLWQRPEQQAAAALRAGDYARAAQLASNADRRGSAEYKRGNYQVALQDFSQATGPQADYNRGNALAKLGRYPDAISAYDQALKAAPDNADARANKAAVEALLKQQQAKSDQDKAAKQQSPQPASGSKGDGAKPGASGSGKGQDSTAGTGKDGESGKEGDKNASNGKGNPGETGKQDGKQDGKGAQGSTPGAGTKPSQEPQAAQGAARRAQASPATAGRDAGHEGTSASAPGQQDATKPAGPAPATPKPGSEFADAARKLATEGSSMPPDKNASSGTDPGAPADAGRPGRRSGAPAASAATNAAQPLPTEEQLAAEQWLRRIPDDPGGLLRRKFLYQYRRQAQAAPADAQ